MPYFSFTQFVELLRLDPVIVTWESHYCGNNLTKEEDGKNEIALAVR